MKIKVDFVTNSSSSSFVVYGISINDASTIINDTFKDNLFKTISKNKKIYGNDEITREEFEEDLDDYVSDYIDELAGEHGLASWKDEYSFILGRYLIDIKDDETLKEFKEKTVESLKNMRPETTIDDIELFDAVIGMGGMLEF